MSDFRDVCEETGFTANKDAEQNSMMSWIDSKLISGVKEELASNYNIELEQTEILDLMEEHGIDFGLEGDYSVADLIFESLQEDE